MTRRNATWLAQRQTTVEIRPEEWALQKKPNSDTKIAVVSVFHANDGSEETLVGGGLVAERKCDDQPHPPEIMGHTGAEVEAVAGKVAYFTHINNVDESGVEWLNLHWQGDLEAFPTAAMAATAPLNVWGFVKLDSSCHLVAS
ncbi:MAG: hypothetical protein WCC03_14210 [Candidatus Acidiferrales bacterium]